MERTNLIAAAFMGVAIVMSCCEKSLAQPPSRFIQQPRPAAASQEAGMLTSDRLVEYPSTQLQWTSRSKIMGGSPQANPQPVHHSPMTEVSTSRNTSFSMPTQNYNASHNDVFSSQSPSNLASTNAASKSTVTTNALLSRIENRMEAIESKLEIAEEPVKRDRIRASMVSASITNDSRFAIDPQSQALVSRIETPQGWQAIGQRLTGHIQKCESLLGRGACCSAREEAEMACLLLMRHIDLHDNLFRCEPAWQSATQALREAEDFLVAQRSAADENVLRRLIDAHETPVLKGKNLAEMSPLTAAQHYRLFAEVQLTEAAQGHPWASELLYTVGRTYQSEADAEPNRVDMLRMKAMAFYNAARVTLPTNAVACNQIGYLLLQMDRNAEAREALAVAVSLQSDVAFLGNLAEASRRLGDSQTATWAVQSVAAVRSRMPLQPKVPSIVEISPTEFASISPRSIGPKPNNETSPAGPAAARTAAVPNATQRR